MGRTKSPSRHLIWGLLAAAAVSRGAAPESAPNWDAKITARWTDSAAVEAPLAQAPQGERMLWYREPAKVWEEALPVGNSHLGAMVFGGAADERLQLNDHNLWDGYPRDTANPAALKALPEVQQLLFAGNNQAAAKLASATMLGSVRGVRPYQSLGELYITTPAGPKVSNYLRKLDLDSALTTVNYSHNAVEYQREIFASAPADLIIVRFTASKPGSIELKLTLRRAQDALCTADPQDPLSILMQGKIKTRETSKGLRFAAQVRAQAQGGKVTNTDGVLTVEKADSLTLFISGATSYPGLAGITKLLTQDPTGQSYSPDMGPDPKAQCQASIERSVARSYEELKAEHIREYQGYFKRAALSLVSPPTDLATNARLAALKTNPAADPALAALYYNFGRYLLISSSRPGSQPANLQGIWAWQMNPPWNADYHTNINVQMNYWPAEPTGLSECHLPLMDLIDSLIPAGNRTAKIHYNASGWVVHHLTDPWGFTAPADGLQGVWPVGAAWLARHPWEHYEFTGDREFLARRAWPQMKGAARFILDFMVVAPPGSPAAGKLVTNPSFSPENQFIQPNGQRSILTYGATMDLMIIRELLTNCMEASRVLDVDADLRRECQNALDRLAPVRIGADGRILEWIEEYKETDPHHRHTSHLYGLYPGDTINHTTPDLMAAARKVLTARGDAGTGWGLAWKIAMWTRLGDGDHAQVLLRNLLQDRTYPNLFDAHAPFQIDGNFGATAAMTEMLLQSQVKDAQGNYELHLLPALPSLWPEGSVYGLRARGGVEVALEWKNARLVKTTLLAAQNRRIKVRYREEVKEITLPAGRRVELDAF